MKKTSFIWFFFYSWFIETFPVIKWFLPKIVLYQYFVPEFEFLEYYQLNFLFYLSKFADEATKMQNMQNMLFAK